MPQTGFSVQDLKVVVRERKGLSSLHCDGLLARPCLHYTHVYTEGLKGVKVTTNGLKVNYRHKLVGDLCTVQCSVGGLTNYKELG